MIYLDNSATTKPFPEVITSFVKVSEAYFGNPSSLHKLGGEAEKLLIQARKQVADLLDVSPLEVIFTAGGSEGNNLAIKGTALQRKNRGNHIITTQIEHPSVSESFEQLKESGFEVTYVPVNSNGVVEISDIKKAIREDTILVSVIHVNNEIGTIQPVAEIGKLLKAYPKIIYHVDHVQGVGKVPLQLQQAGIDLCTLSGHKFNGLKGTGILYVRKGVELAPLISGGQQEMQLRSGTENVAGIVAMTKALRMTLENMDEKVEKINQIKRAILDGLETNAIITINTPSYQTAPHIINFSINGLKSEVFVHLLEENGIILSTTSACSSKKKAPSKTLLAMKKDEPIASSAIRMSLSAENELEEVPYILNAINKAIDHLGKVMR
ncbi:cysteine desulfurase family protein [Bacillus sp. PS06]|uniref:cysteine desulfurase family protein n=1 Tax=Bacillus sp. PS06 TaxID=2764176 RepID=UPI0017811D1E|nr:cysteine desulfurase family protein [Bacillus sp. PS06]MBD8068986.1 cysteine desulfurase [Bacillus sp. PS06]